MKVIEAIERAKSSGCAENTSNDILRDSIIRLEVQIAKKAGLTGVTDGGETIPQSPAVTALPSVPLLSSSGHFPQRGNQPFAQGSLASGDINDESVLLACGGGVAEGYDDMYDAYLKREASRICETWDNYGNYDTVFNIRYQELCKEIIRNRKPKRFEFSS